MPTYEYGKIKVLARELASAEVEPAVIEEIMAGGEAIKQRATPKRKTAWLVEAMVRMDDLLPEDVRYAVREACACCLGGKRERLSKAIARNHATLEERIAAANETPYVFGHSVEMLADGRVQVMFDAPGKESYRCVCLPKAEGAVSATYCYCCGGHVKHHLQNALGRALTCEVVETALSTAGQAPCTFRFTLAEAD